MLYDAEPAADDAEARPCSRASRAGACRWSTKCEVSIIEETQPRWLAFLNGSRRWHQYGSVPGDFVTQAMPNGKIAPNLAKHGIAGDAARQPGSASLLLQHGRPHRRWLRAGTTWRCAARWRSAIDVDRGSSRVLYRGQGIPAQSALIPHTSGYDPKFKSEMGDHDPARARALLDLYGYIDRDGDGYREIPDGKPLVLDAATSQPDQIYRQFDESVQKDLHAVGINVKFKTGQWAEQLKEARAGKLQMWTLGGFGHGTRRPGRAGALPVGRSPARRTSRASRTHEFDRSTIAAALPDGPEREALFAAAKMIGGGLHALQEPRCTASRPTWHPWVIGYRRPLFWQRAGTMVDIDMKAKPQ